MRGTCARASIFSASSARALTRRDSARRAGGRTRPTVRGGRCGMGRCWRAGGAGSTWRGTRSMPAREGTSMRNRRPHYEEDDATFTAEAYTVAGWGRGIAFSVLGWETEPTEDTEWDGIEERTGRVVCVMVGDD